MHIPALVLPTLNGRQSGKEPDAEGPDTIGDIYPNDEHRPATRKSGV